MVAARTAAGLVYQPWPGGSNPRFAMRRRHGQAKNMALAGPRFRRHAAAMKSMTAANTLTVRRAAERGHFDHGWLDTWHTFSFADYYDPAHLGFRSLRVINDDRVAPGRGFPTHPHRDMEIFSYVLAGTIEHRDSLGNGRQLRPGQIQLMSAGTGVTHSEFNPSPAEPLHLLQIWIRPRARGLTPRYTEWHPRPEHERAAKVLVISPDGRDDSATIQQDAEVYRLRLEPGQRVTHELQPGRGAWLQIATGRATLNGVPLEAGDGASTEAPGLLTLAATENTEALLFDLA
jgi:redox-sensitive bicupin YhaK (pirin superfamily)